MLKAGVSDSFYLINLRPADAPETGLIFPVDDGNKPLVAIYLTLPMRWNNLPPFFCTLTETVNDLMNQALYAHSPSRIHKLDDCAAAVVSAAAHTLGQ